MLQRRRIQVIPAEAVDLSANRIPPCIRFVPLRVLRHFVKWNLGIGANERWQRAASATDVPSPDDAAREPHNLRHRAALVCWRTTSGPDTLRRCSRLPGWLHMPAWESRRFCQDPSAWRRTTTPSTGLRTILSIPSSRCVISQCDRTQRQLSLGTRC